MPSLEVLIGMDKNDLDLVIIGAGATGSSIALEACKRGLKVALIDSGDISGGTSCRSTKLLHGGVRYLEIAFKKFDLAQLNLVKEALTERGYWLKEAPFLARQLELAIPTNNCLTKGYYGLGLKFYDYLAGDKGISKSRLISSSEMQSTFPMLKECSSGGVAYSDGQFDDARLNLLLALTAENAGAIVSTHCKVIDFEYKTTGKLKGIITKSLNGEEKRWQAKVIVNATGVNSDSIRMKVDNSAKKRITTSRGIHIVLKENLCQGDKGLLLPSTSDGRVLFILPFFNQTLVGTTDTPCDIDEAKKTSHEEKDYLLDHIKKLFPQLENPNIKSSWAGGRPLLKPKESKNSSQIVREHEIEILPCGLISAMGGKWTTCRKIAIDTLKAVEVLLGQSLPQVKHLPLIGTNKDNSLTLLHLKRQYIELKEYLPQTKLLEKQVIHLQAKYGLNALKLIASCSPSERNPLSEVIPICKAEIIEDIKNEHAMTPTDILARRNRLAMVDYQEAQRLLPLVQEHLSIASLPIKELDLEE